MRQARLTWSAVIGSASTITPASASAECAMSTTASMSLRHDLVVAGEQRAAVQHEVDLVGALLQRLAGLERLDRQDLGAVR